MEKPFCYFSERFCSSLAQKIDFNSKKLRWQRFPNVTQREVLMVAAMPTGPTVNLSLGPAGAIGGESPRPPSPKKNPPFWIPPSSPLLPVSMRALRALLPVWRATLQFQPQVFTATAFLWNISPHCSKCQTRLCLKRE